MPEETGHSPVGASGAHRWMECPGSVALCAKIPDETSEFAQEGTDAHEMAEGMLHGMDVAGNPELQEMRRYCAKYVNEVLRCHSGAENPSRIDVEKVVSLPEIDDRLYGTVDAMFIEPASSVTGCPGRVHVFDLKYGKGIEVEVENNPQLLYYALCAYNQQIGAIEVVLTIVQPRISGRTIKSITYTHKEMMDFAEKLRKAIKAVDEEPQQYNPGPKQCQWCAGSAICPAKARNFQALTNIEAEAPLTVIEQKTEDLTLEQLGQIYTNKKMLEKWLNDVEKHVSKLVHDGTKVPGTKMVRRVKNRVIKNPKEAAKILKKAGFKEKDYMTKPKIISPAKLEGIGVEKNLVASISFKPEGDLVVAPLSDNRQDTKVLMSPKTEGSK